MTKILWAAYRMLQLESAQNWRKSVLCIALLFPGVVQAQDNAAPTTLPENAAAVINEIVIPYEQVSLLMKNVLRRSLQGPVEISEEAALKLWQDTRQLLIDYQLLKQEAVRRGYKPEEGTNEDDREAPARSVSGALAMKLQEEMLRIERYLEPAYTEGWVTEETIKAMFKANPDRWGGTEAAKAGQILIRPDGMDEKAVEEARVKAREIYDSIKNGDETFEEMARTHSQDRYASQSGSMGIVRKKWLIPSIGEALFSSEPGKVSEPIQSAMGFYILRLEEKISAKSLDDARDQIERDLRASQLPKGRMLFIQRLGAQALIQLGPDPEGSDLVQSIRSDMEPAEK